MGKLRERKPYIIPDRSLAECSNLYETEIFQVDEYDPKDVRVRTTSLIFRNGKDELSVIWTHHHIGNSLLSFLSQNRK